MADIIKSPVSNYSGQIVVDPLTRIEGHLRIEVEVENGKVSSAKSMSTLFRGLEIILKGRDPRDAQHFTQRTCGVCTYTHALASTRALENAMQIEIPKNATLIRNLVLATQDMHDHLVHFYHLHALDFVDVASASTADLNKTAQLSASISAKPISLATLKATQDKLKSFIASGQLGPFTNAYFLGSHPAYILSPEQNLIATTHYIEALHVQVKIAKAMAIFGAKNPHTQFLVAGGITCYEALRPERIKEYEDLLVECRDFINNAYIPDLIMIAGVYKDWTNIGGTSNFMTCDEFPDGKDSWFKNGLIYNRDLSNVINFNKDLISEHVKHSWYVGDEARKPYDGVTDPKFTSLDDKERYSWMKAPRYDGKSVETGPLAQVLLSYIQGQPECVALTNTVLSALSATPEILFSTLGRTAARGIQTAMVANKQDEWLAQLKENLANGDNKIVINTEVPDKAEGVGIVNAPRGLLSHWLRIEDKKIANFQLVVPSTWNLGPRCANNLPSPVEEALVGTPIADPKRPVEILRTVHSYDPCIACGVHVINHDTGEKSEFMIR